MNRRGRVDVIIVAMVASLIGGMMGRLSLSGAQAQDEPAGVKIIAAEEFHVMGAGKKVLAKLAATDGAPSLSMFDQEGHLRASLRLTAAGEPSLLFHDRAGRIIYRTVPFTVK